MFRQQTRTARRRIQTLDFGLWALDFTANGGERFRVNHARTQYLRRRHRQIEHGGFDADLRLATIHDQRNLVAELLAHVPGIGR